MSGWNKKKVVMRDYDSSAHIYDIRYAEEQAAKIEAALESINLEKQDLMLDVGCGTGLLFRYAVGKVKTIVGLDISKKILLLAKNRAKKLSSAHLIWADADMAPLREEIFDHVFAVTLLQNMPNPAETLSEVKRVAKENAVITLTGLKKKFSSQSFEELLQKSGLAMVSLSSQNPKCHVAICANSPHMR